MKSYDFLIASYTHYLEGKHTNLGGPAQHLAKYLGKRCYCVWQPIPIGKPNWVYLGLKIRDFFKLLCLIRPARAYVGVESLNALVGACGRKIGLFHKIIYWNMDYSPTRGRIWGFFDKLAQKWADEVWVLKDRGLPKQKVVPIGAWLKEIDLSKPRKPGIVYIGLLEDMQGVGLMLEHAQIWTSVQFHVIGSGKDENKYKALNLPNVKFYGILSDKDAQEIMTTYTEGWAMYHPDNPTIKTTMPTKITTYLSCGLKVLTNISYEPARDWNDIFREALCG